MIGLFRKNFKIGLDLGGNSLKYAIVEADRGIIHHLWASEIMPERQLKDESLKGEELEQRLTSLLKKCQKECPIYGNTVNTAIQGEGTICRYLELPVLNKRELDVAVTSQAIKYIPFPMDGISLSYITVPSVMPGDNKTGIFFVAAQKNSVEGMKILLEKSGLVIERMETPLLALTREVWKNHNLPRDLFFALVHVGFRLTHVVVMRDRYPYYAREFSIGGRDFTYAFQMGLQSSWEEAETYKRNCDVAKCAIELEPSLNRWLEEVKKSLEFFSRQFPGEAMEVQQVFLSGGTSVWKGLIKRLDDYMDIPVVLDDLAQLKEERKEPKIGENAIYKVAIGLALND